MSVLIIIYLFFFIIIIITIVITILITIVITIVITIINNACQLFPFYAVFFSYFAVERKKMKKISLKYIFRCSALITQLVRVSYL